MNEAPQRTVTFNVDGSVDREQLVGYPQEFIDQVTDPAFQKRAKQMIAADIRRQRNLAQLRNDIAATRQKAVIEQQARRPSGVSGRQRKRLRRIARKLSSATIPPEAVPNGESCKPA